MDSINFYLFWIEAWVWKYFAFQKFIILVNSIRRLCSNLNSLFIVVNNWTVMNILCWEHFRKYPSKSLSVFKTSSTRLQRINFASSKASWRCLEVVLKAFCKDIFKTSWKTKNCYAEDICWRRYEDMSSRRLEDIMEAKYLLGIFVTNKSKCVFNKSIFHKSISDNSRANPKCII